MNRPDDLAASRLETAAPTRSVSDELISIADIRRLFKLGRTAAYELTHRPEFPDHFEISPHCYRWWASEVYEFAAARQRIYSRRETVCNPRSRATMVHPIRGPDWLASFGPRHPGSGKLGDPIRIGSGQPGNGGPREVKEIYGNRRSLAWSRAKEPRPIG